MKLFTKIVYRTVTVSFPLLSMSLQSWNQRYMLFGGHAAPTFTHEAHERTEVGQMTSQGKILERLRSL